MKKYWLTIIVAVIFIVLLGYVIYIYKFKTVEQAKPQVIFQTDVSKISSVALTSKGASFELRKANGKYVMDIPEQVPSVQNKIQGIFETASKIDYESVISQNETNLSQYGFDNPNALVKINMADGTSKTFQVGMQTPSGDGYYFREYGQNTVYKISSDAAKQFTQGVNDITDKDIFAGFDKNTADKVVVSYNNQTTAIEKKNGAWWFDGKQMKQDKTNQLMDQFQAAAIDGVSPKDKYVNTSIPPLIRIVVYGNGKEYLNAAIFQRDAASLTVIKEGMAGAQYYVSMDAYNKMRDNLVKVFQDAIAS